ncbi:MAG: hypothetical protein E7052_08340 [Lentisphaerae bacterium]|nr:hypothetical protein [Lentisphaerota bacterium]
MVKKCLLLALAAWLGGCAWLPDADEKTKTGKKMEDMNMTAENPAVMVQKILAAGKPEGWKASSFDRNRYIDIVERIVRMAGEWVNEDGAVIDPVLKAEHGQTSSRFASSCAAAIYFGRCPELKEKLYRVMDHCCNALKQPGSVERSPDFWMRELAVAYYCLKDIAPPEKLAAWRRDLSEVIPEKNYKFVSPQSDRRYKFHNWAVYAAAGESMRQALGISGPDNALWGERFFDEYMRFQLWRFNEYGMYRDPGDPVTYDITTRLQLEAALAMGYKGIWRDGLRKILDEAMLATLLFMAPGGDVPFGGRSAHFYFREGIISALCELAASRCKTSDPKLAGAFKRQAHLAALATADGLMRKDGKIYHIKNFFDPATRHGCDMYGHYSVYSLLAASNFAQAALFSDDTIQEYPAPAEVGGFAFGLSNNFYKFFCNQSGNYLEFELQPVLHYDACGLGRIVMKDLPWGLLPVLPFAQNKYYIAAEGLPENRFNDAVAPEWINSSGELQQLASLTQTPGSYSQLEPGVWQVKYQAGDVQIVYTADLRQVRQLTLTVSVSGNARDADMIIPILNSNGADKPILNLQGSTLTAVMRGKTLQIVSDGAEAVKAGQCVNRTGVYDRIKIPIKGESIKLIFSVK